eukprot:scaffold38795_cov47-Phaeocystis_antarctica.AAC.3
MCGASLHDNCGLPLLGGPSTASPRGVICPLCRAGVPLCPACRDRRRADGPPNFNLARAPEEIGRIASRESAELTPAKSRCRSCTAALSARARDDLAGAVLGPLPAGTSSGEVRWHGACGHHQIVRPPDRRSRAAFLRAPAPFADAPRLLRALLRGGLAEHVLRGCRERVDWQSKIQLLAGKHSTCPAAAHAAAAALASAPCSLPEIYVHAS